MLRWMLAMVLAGGLCTSVWADEPQKKQDPEKIPAPKVRIEASVVEMPYLPPRRDTMEVWQHYGVNSMGRFVPRVIVLPHGSYYSRDLQPYPWTSNRTTAVLPRE